MSIKAEDCFKHLNMKDKKNKKDITRINGSYFTNVTMGRLDNIISHVADFDLCTPLGIDESLLDWSDPIALTSDYTNLWLLKKKSFQEFCPRYTIPELVRSGRQL